MNLRRSATHAAFWGLAQKWGYHAVRLLVFVVLARLLDPASFGVVALAGVFVLLGEMLVDQGFADALVQRTAVGPAHLDSAFWASFAIGVMLTAGCVLFAGPLAAVFDEPRLAPVLRALGPVLLITSLSRTHEALLRRELAFKRIAKISLASVAVGGAAGLWLAMLGYGVWALVAQLLVQRLVQLPCLWFSVAWRPRLRFSLPHFRALARFGVNVVGINLLNVANRQADHLLIGYFLGSTALGYYTVGYRLIRILLDLLPQAIMPVAFSAFSRLKAEPVRLREAFYEATRVMALGAFPAFCGLALLAPAVTEVVFGPQWAPSASVMQVLTAIAALQSISLLCPAALKALGRPQWVLLITAANAVANVAAFAIAVHWGIVAVAAAYAVRGYLLWPLTWTALDRLVSLSPRRYLGALMPALVGCGVMAFAVRGIASGLPGDWGAFARLLALVPMGAVVYVAAAFTVAPAQCRALAHQVLQRHPVQEARS